MSPLFTREVQKIRIVYVFEASTRCETEPREAGERVDDDLDTTYYPCEKQGMYMKVNPF
jgi:hypothetical protein